jgi:uncharacterized protein
MTTVDPRSGARESATESNVTQHNSKRSVGIAAYALAGLLFGFFLTKGEVISWFRIQEMFRFQGFHMYGVFMTAVPTALLGIQILKRVNARTLSNEPISIPRKELGKGIRYIAGGLTFGIGWALTGACPGPLFALLGSGVLSIALAIVSALLGTWTYGIVRKRLPH